MLLITGGTGFIGARFAQKLIKSNHNVRILLRPQKKSPELPRNVAMEIAVSSLQDMRSLRAALKNIKIVFHFATTENQGINADFDNVDIGGTEKLMEAAKDAGVQKVLYLSRIGAERNSSYPVLKAKALAEDIIKRSGISYTIIRLTDVFGNRDHFTSQIESAIRHSPGFLPIPGERTNLQPLWIEDLTSCLLMIHEENIFKNLIYEIGGGEYLGYQEIIKIIMRQIHKKRILVPVSPAYLRLYNLWFKQYRESFPLSTHWLDLLAVDRTCPLNSLTRNFDLLPARFSHHLSYLQK
jgi:uncharacterized protein YbjT (DUF2867 family)